MLFLGIIVLVLIAACVAVSTVLGARRKAAASGDSDSDSQSFIGGVLNALFTVVLAFYIVFAWQNGDDIEKAAQQEANALVDTHWQVAAAPPQQAGAIRDLTDRYAERVAEQEWSALDEGRMDPEVTSVLNGLRAEVLALPAEDAAVKPVREQALQNVRQIDEGHRERVDVATDNQNFNLVLLGGSVLGAVLMVVFPLVVGLSMRPANVASMVLLTCTLGLTIYLSIGLLHPLSGPFGVDPDALETARQEFEVATPSGV